MQIGKIVKLIEPTVPGRPSNANNTKFSGRRSFFPGQIFEKGPTLSGRARRGKTAAQVGSHAPVGVPYRLQLQLAEGPSFVA